MSGIKFTKKAAPSSPPVNQATVYYDTADSILKAKDENANISKFGEFTVTGYKLNRIVTITASGTYTPATGTRALFVECIAGGGGAGGCAVTAASQTSASTGGSGGGYAAKWVTGTIKSSYTVAIGAGGTAAAAGNNAGGSGGDTTFDSPSICTSSGGSGGNGSAAFTTNTFVSGVNGNSGTAVGDMVIAGRPSEWSWGTTTACVGGRGGAGPLGGNLAPSMNSQGANFNGIGYGSGGSGSAITASHAAVGGSTGVAGVIRIYEYF